MRHTELLTDHAYVARHPAFVWHHTRPADHFQIGHFREVSHDLVLNAIGEKGVLLFLARLLNGSTAMLFSGGATFDSGERSDPVFHIITPNGKAKTRSIAAITAILGLRRTHFLPRVTSPVRRARIGSCFSQRSRSSASASAESYR